MLRRVIWHLLWRFEPKWISFWDEATFRTLLLGLSIKNVLKVFLWHHEWQGIRKCQNPTLRSIFYVKNHFWFLVSIKNNSSGEHFSLTIFLMTSIFEAELGELILTHNHHQRNFITELTVIHKRLQFFIEFCSLPLPPSPVPLLDCGRSLWIVPYQNHMAKILECNKEVGASPTQFMIKNKTQQNSSKQPKQLFY